MPDDKPKRGRPRKGEERPKKEPRLTPHPKAAKNTAITTVVQQLRRNPNLSYSDLGKLNGTTHVAMIKLLQRHGITKEQVEDYKASRADLFAGMQDKIVASITNEDLQKASLRDKVIAAATLYDKERLERGLNTSTTLMIYASAVELADKRPQDIVVEAEVVAENGPKDE